MGPAIRNLTFEVTAVGFEMFTVQLSVLCAVELASFDRTYVRSHRRKKIFVQVGSGQSNGSACLDMARLGFLLRCGDAALISSELLC